MEKRILIIELVLLLLFSSITPISIGFNIKISELVGLSSYRGNILYVGGSGLNNYTNIQDAIDNAIDGDTVFIYNGIYYENLIINKKITLFGEDNYSTIIDGSQNLHNPVILVTASPFNFCNLSIRNASINTYGIWVKNTTNDSMVLNCRFFNAFRGFDAWDSSNISITNCSIFDIRDGIMLIRTKNIKVEHCDISTLQRGISINIGSQRNMIIDCKITGNATGGFYGIDIYNNDNVISNCIIANEMDGIAIFGDNTKIDNCSIYNNIGRGFQIGTANYTIIENCSVTNNGNYDYEPSYGIEVLGGSYNYIGHCTISDNGGGGILFNAFTKHNIIIKSTIEHNGYLSANGGEGVVCASSNTIYLNNFLNNKIQASDEYSNSNWDNGNFGNYWSDYKEKYPYAHRLWHEGIWNTPYEIPCGNSLDNFPLIKPFNKPRNRTINIPLLNILFYDTNLILIIQKLLNRQNHAGEGILTF